MNGVGSPDSAPPANYGAAAFWRTFTSCLQPEATRTSRVCTHAVRHCEWARNSRQPVSRARVGARWVRAFTRSGIELEDNSAEPLTGYLSLYSYATLCGNILIRWILGLNWQSTILCCSLMSFVEYSSKIFTYYYNQVLMFTFSITHSGIFKIWF